VFHAPQTVVWAIQDGCREVAIRLWAVIYGVRPMIRLRLVSEGVRRRSDPGVPWRSEQPSSPLNRLFLLGWADDGLGKRRKTDVLDRCGLCLRVDALGCRMPPQNQEAVAGGLMRWTNAQVPSLDRDRTRIRSSVTTQKCPAQSAPRSRTSRILALSTSGLSPASRNRITPEEAGRPQ
jgi:hypothetical protein